VHRAALIAAGLLLFVLTLFINLIARYFVVRAEKSTSRRVPEGMAGG
jgi:ABC-type phosphate transport system permease subunit